MNTSKKYVASSLRQCLDKASSYIASATFVSKAGTQAAITAAKSSRDITKNMVRVRSSNVWAYGIDVKRNGDSTGNVIVQFKGEQGGPGDIYILYDVPIRVYRRWVSAPSKGHFYWEYLRDNYQYSKLTGDKRGKLRNAIN